MLSKVKKIHMVGIGGCGMSAIAEILYKMGYEISGSDIAENDYIKRLMSLGIRIFKGHNKENIKDVQLVIKSSAIKENNPELLEAKERGIPIMLRGEALGWLMRLKDGIAVAGTHGKTTTTSLLAKTLIYAGFDPIVLVGGKLKCIGSNAFYGKGRFILAEADESDGTFLCLNPKIGVVTSIDKDHMDFYKDIEEIRQSFKRFMENVSEDGICVVYGDDENIEQLIKGIKKRVLTYGLNDKNYISAELVDLNCKSVFDVFIDNRFWSRVVLSIPGVHNVLNAMATIGVGVFLGIPKEKILEALKTFEGVGRRLDVKGTTQGGIIVIDDYGHHPREIELTLNTVKHAFKPSRLIVVFQPHRYSRTKALYEEFCKCFKDSDILIMLPIYSAGEDVMISDVKEEKLCKEIENTCSVEKVYFCPGFDECIATIKRIANSGDVVITVGAGDVWKIGEMLLNRGFI